MKKADWVGIAFGLAGGALLVLTEEYHWVAWTMLGVGAAILLWHGVTYVIKLRQPKPEETRGPRTQTLQLPKGIPGAAFLSIDGKNNVLKGLTVINRKGNNAAGVVLINEENFKATDINVGEHPQPEKTKPE